MKIDLSSYSTPALLEAILGLDRALPAARPGIPHDSVLVLRELRDALNEERARRDGNPPAPGGETPRREIEKNASAIIDILAGAQMVHGAVWLPAARFGDLRDAAIAILEREAAESARAPAPEPAANGPSEDDVGFLARGLAASIEDELVAEAVAQSAPARDSAFFAREHLRYLRKVIGEPLDGDSDRLLLTRETLWRMNQSLGIVADALRPAGDKEPLPEEPEGSAPPVARPARRLENHPAADLEAAARVLRDFVSTGMGATEMDWIIRAELDRREPGAGRAAMPSSPPAP